MAPLEPWEKVLVDAEAFPETVHGQIACTDCHGGQSSPDKEEAHADLIPYPSQDPKICRNCHPEISEAYPDALHSTQEGYWSVLEERGASRDHEAMQEMFGNHCASCHTSCGDCHVSQPQSVGGGFIDGHLFNASPSMTRNCTACHGSRVGNEYLGKNEDIKADIHFRQGRMKCTDCHPGSELHAMDPEEPAIHRLEGSQTPACKDCHTEVGAANDPLQMHTIHGEKLSCQVCHSESYTSCDGCHVAISDKTGNPFFSTEGHYLSFFIGKNPLLDENRPYEYSLLRHVPVAPTSFEYYGEDMLPNFDALPTWVYATPHNIQRNTPQNESCEACHGNQDIFLTAEKVAEAELSANQGVIVDSPPPIGGTGDDDDSETATGSPFPPVPENHYGITICVACHEVIPEPAWPAGHMEYSDDSCLDCHQPTSATEGGSTE